MRHPLGGVRNRRREHVRGVYFELRALVEVIADPAQKIHCRAILLA
jgi:hypothetical protein